MITNIKKNDLLYILNENNKYITPEYIENLLESYSVNVKVRKIDLYKEAMNHLSYLIRDEKFYKNNKTKPYQIQSNDIEPLDDISKAIPLQKKSYERLEFVGDAICHAVIAEYLFKRYDDQDEGFMTKLRTKIENGDTFSILSKKIGLGEYVIISRYVEKNGGRETNKAILEDAFEAFIGALYFNEGYDKCKTFIINLIEKEIDLGELIYTETNFKEKLLQFFHLRKWKDPIYGSLDISGPENRKKFTRYVKCRKDDKDEGTIIATGVATSVKAAEQLAAKNALKEFGFYNEEDDEEEEYEELSDTDSESASVSEYETDDE